VCADGTSPAIAFHHSIPAWPLKTPPTSASLLLIRFWVEIPTRQEAPDSSPAAPFGSLQFRMRCLCQEVFVCSGLWRL
jgi:hypothetical protein